MALKKRYLFFLAVLAGIGMTLGPIAYDRLWKGRPPKTTKLSRDVAVTTQLEQAQMQAVRRAGYKTIVDFRPDSEVDQKSSSTAMKEAAESLGLNFAYIPVPHGDKVPEASVEKLLGVLGSSHVPFLLYCRSGRRATRTWSLAEASRKGGVSAAEIYQAAKKSGISIDDLKASITERIAKRSDRK
ncbi:MAG: sulfur transferase domain-containing protein [Armatimonas sp.]